MIISVEEVKKLVALGNWDDAKIERKLKAVEQTIRAYSNNNFQNRSFRERADIKDGALSPVVLPFKVGDTVQISESQFNNGLYTVESTSDGAFRVKESTIDENSVLITKIEYPADVVECALNIMEWEKNNRQKVGIQSETLSRHSVTYFNQDADNQVMGYPASLMGCLKPYKKARC